MLSRAFAGLLVLGLGSACGKTVSLGHGHDREQDSGGRNGGSSSGTDGGRPGGRGGNDVDQEPEGGDVGEQMVSEKRSTIRGQVVTLLEQPRAGLTVLVSGVPYITDIDGRFEAETILPYDLVLHHAERLSVAASQ
jgi:hypothetical protein